MRNPAGHFSKGHLHESKNGYGEVWTCSSGLSRGCLNFYGNWLLTVVEVENGLHFYWVLGHIREAFVCDSFCNSKVKARGRTYLVFLGSDKHQNICKTQWLNAMIKFTRSKHISWPMILILTFGLCTHADVKSFMTGKLHSKSRVQLYYQENLNTSNP